MRFQKSVTLAVMLACATAPLQAETRIGDALKTYTLDNGMRIFVYQRNTAPMFAGMIYVDAGSAEENVNETGLAHLLEHMAFKGTPWIGTKDWEKERPILVEVEKAGVALAEETRKVNPDPKIVEDLRGKLVALEKKAAEFTVPNEYDQIITRAGGTDVNASTSVDFTNYYMNMPSNQFELWAMMESQRMVYPAWREFYKERDVVAEERRMRYEDSPTGKLYETYLSSSFKAHAYRNPTIGWMSDIYNLTVKATDDFYKAWYVPENMVAVIVGDVNPDEVRSVMDKYFGSIPARKGPPKASTKEPEQSGERRVKVRFDAEPMMMLGWHKPTFPDKDAYVIEVIQYLMSRTGRSSRLYERMVKKDGICQEVDAFTAPGDKYPNTFAIMLSTRAPHTTAEAERVALEEIERIKTESVPDAELDKIRNQIDANYVKELESNQGFARQLGYSYLITKDPNVLDTMRDEMKKVTAQDIMRVAQKYFTEDNRTVIELVKSPKSKPAPKEPISLVPEKKSETTATQSGQEAEK